MDTLINFVNQIVLLFQENPIAQTAWFIWYWVSVYAFWFCKNNNFIKAMAVLSFFWALHFYMIWAISAFFVNFVDVFKAWFALKYWKNKKVALFFLFLYIIWWYLFYENLISLIPILTAIFWLYLTFFVRGLYLNLWYLLIVCFWFFYNIYHGSIWWVASDVTLFFTWIYWIVTMFVLKTKSEE